MVEPLNRVDLALLDAPEVESGRCLFVPENGLSAACKSGRREFSFIQQAWIVAGRAGSVGNRTNSGG